MIRLAGVVLALLLAPTAATAETDLRQELTKCAGEENDIARLQCFDGVAAALEPEAAEVAAEAAPPKPAPKLPRRPTSAKTIVEADERMVENCEFLGTVVGKSGWGGLASGAASRGSMKSAKKKAARLGATHIVVGHFENSAGLKSSTTQTRAYACDEDG